MVVRSLLAVMLLTTLADPPVRIIRFQPQTGFAPLFVRFTVAIEPHADNREWCYAFVEPGLDEPTILHCEDLDGDRAAKFYTREEKSVDAGEYQVLAAVVRKGGTVVRSVPMTLRVQSVFADPD